MLSKVQVWIICYATSDFQSLKVLLFNVLQERGGGWHPVTGHVESGEALEDAAMREAHEETGLSFKGRPNPIGMEFNFTGRFGPALETVFFLKTNAQTDPTLDPKEHIAFKWCTVTEAFEMIEHDFQKKALTLLSKTLLAKIC